MSVYKRERSPFYYYEFERNGTRHRGSTGCTDRREAAAKVRQIIRDVEEAERRRDGASELTLRDATARYWTEVCEHGASPRADLVLLERLARLVGLDRDIRTITDATVAAAVAARRTHYRMDRPALGPVSASTVNRSVTDLLRRVLSRARKVWGVSLPVEPNWGAHRLAEPTERVRELGYDEEAKLEAVERDDYRVPRLFAQITGLRRREVASLTWRQIDFAAETISVIGKGNKPHVLPLTDELRALLEPLRGHHPTAVFTYVAQRTREVPKAGRSVVKGQRYPITYEGLGTHLGRTFDKAGLEGFRVHDLRHTAATRALRATGNLRFVQQLLAHSSPTTTARYAHTDLSDMRRLMAATAADDARRREAAVETSCSSPSPHPLEAPPFDHAPQPA